MGLGWIFVELDFGGRFRGRNRDQLDLYNDLVLDFHRDLDLYLDLDPDLDLVLALVDLACHCQREQATVEIEVEYYLAAVASIACPAFVEVENKPIVGSANSPVARRESVE